MNHHARQHLPAWQAAAGTVPAQECYPTLQSDPGFYSQPEPTGPRHASLWQACIRAQQELATALSGTTNNTILNHVLAATDGSPNAVAASLFFTDKTNSDASGGNAQSHIQIYTKSVPRMIASMRTMLKHWVFVCFYDATVPTTLVQTLQRSSKSNRVPAIFIKMGVSTLYRSGTFWRFLANDFFRLTYFRDIEMEFQPFDLLCINDFQNRSALAAYSQIVHERTWKNSRIMMAGVFMAKAGINMTAMMHNWWYWHYYGSDEQFLTNRLHPSHQIIVYSDIKTTPSVARLTEFKQWETRQPFLHIQFH